MKSILTTPRILMTLSIVALALSTLDALLPESSPSPWAQSAKFNELFKEMGTNGAGFREYKHRQTGIEFVEIPGGTYTRGSRLDSPFAEENEFPPQSISLSPFLIAKYEVTHGEWKKLMPEGELERYRKIPNNVPRTDVSWLKIYEFLDQTQLQLPSESQWELASLGPQGERFSSEGLQDQAWTKRNSHVDSMGLIETKPHLHAVGKKMPNGYGLFDMLGNAWEWCEDNYEPSFYHLEESTKKNPVCRSTSPSRVLRGGSYLHDEVECRPSFRRGLHADKKAKNVGFRPVFNLSSI